MRAGACRVVQCSAEGGLGAIKWGGIGIRPTQTSLYAGPGSSLSLGRSSHPQYLNVWSKGNWRDVEYLGIIFALDNLINPWILATRITTAIQSQSPQEPDIFQVPLEQLLAAFSSNVALSSGKCKYMSLFVVKHYNANIWWHNVAISTERLSDTGNLLNWPVAICLLAISRIVPSNVTIWKGKLLIIQSRVIITASPNPWLRV